MTDLNTDLLSMKAKLLEVERKLKKATGALAEFHAGAAAMIEKYGPQCGLDDDQIQPLSGGEGGKDDPVP